MDPVTIVAIVVGLALVAGVAFFLWQRQRTQELERRYGPEYQRALSEHGNRRKAEADLVKRKERVEKLDIRPLSADQRERFAHEWRAVQAKFVDEPREAVTDADRLVDDVMKAKGYPTADFERRMADLSVHHPQVLDSYRAAGEIAQRHRRGEAGTEDLRQAMVYYRDLFEDLLSNREVVDDREREREVNRDAARDDGRGSAARMREPVNSARRDREVRP